MVFCTSTITPAEGSTAESSSTARTHWKKVPPCPPYSSGISMPIRPISKNCRKKRLRNDAASSISRTSGGSARARIGGRWRGKAFFFAQARERLRIRFGLRRWLGWPYHRHSSHADRALPLPALRFGHAAMRDVAVIGIHARASAGMVRAGALQALVRELQQVGKRGVGQREGGGMRHRGRHVRDAVVQHAVDEIDRLGVRGGVRGFEAAALVDGDIHHHRAALHVGDHFAAHQLGRRSARDQHRADYQVGGLQVSPMVQAFDASVTTMPLKMSSSSRRRFRLRSMMVTCAPMPSAILAALVPTMPPPRITTFAGATPGTPPSRMPRPPFGVPGIARPPARPCVRRLRSWA